MEGFRYLLLVWDETGEEENAAKHFLSVDLLPEYILLSPRTRGEHLTAMTGCDGKFEKTVKSKFHSRSVGNLTAINYGKKENENNNIHTGTLLLNFNSLSKESLLSVLWRNDICEPDLLDVSRDSISPTNATWLNLAKKPTDLVHGGKIKDSSIMEEIFKDLNLGME